MSEDEPNSNDFFGSGPIRRSTAEEREKVKAGLMGAMAVMPKYPSATLTIGVVLKGLIDSGILTMREDGELGFTYVGQAFCRMIKVSEGLEDYQCPGLQLKIDF